MSPRIYKKQTSFDEHLPEIIKLSKMQGYKQKEFLKMCDVRESSPSEWTRGAKNFTAFYFLKLLGGLGMTVSGYLKATGKELTEDQKFEIDLQKFVARKSKKFKKVMEDPRSLKLLNQLLNGKVKL